MGGAVGVLLAWWGTNLLIALKPQNLPRLDEIAHKTLFGTDGEQRRHCDRKDDSFHGWPRFDAGLDGGMFGWQRLTAYA